MLTIRNSTQEEKDFFFFLKESHAVSPLGSISRQSMLPLFPEGWDCVKLAKQGFS